MAMTKDQEVLELLSIIEKTSELRLRTIKIRHLSESARQQIDNKLRDVEVILATEARHKEGRD